MKIIPAEKLYVSDLDCLINLAGEGIPQYLFSQITEGGQSPLAVEC